jgi:hypothetical protein
MIQVRYIGRKPVRTDNISNSGAVWIGAGDVQPVADEAWAKLRAHPDVWELAEADDPAPAGLSLADATPAANTAPAEPLAKPENWDALTAAELKAWAKAAGKKIDGRLSADAMRLALA